MILIQSIPGEYTTGEVSNWIRHNKGSFYRFNNNYIEDCTVELGKGEPQLCFEQNRINLKDIQSVWLRKIGYQKTVDLSHLEDSIAFKSKLNKLVTNESNTFTKAIYKVLKNKPWLSHPDIINLNKIDILMLAQEAGLDIPITLISSSKSEILAFIQEHKKVITKNIYEAEIFEHNGYNYWQYTQQVKEEHLADYDEEMFPCLLQTMIDKEVELRIFYLNGKCYSMAIFSQLDEQTAMDFRKYNDVKPNRYVPYKLPEKIEINIKKFMDLANLNTGSIDMIKSNEGQYVFLEVNPVGQFGMTSRPCNYYLEKKVAEWLMNPTFP